MKNSSTSQLKGEKIYFIGKKINPKNRDNTDLSNFTAIGQDQLLKKYPGYLGSDGVCVGKMLKNYFSAF